MLGSELAGVVPPRTDYGTVADLLRLLVVPAFGYAAYRDIRTRRVDGRLWAPLVVVGLVALLLDFSRVGTTSFSGERFLFRVGVSLGLVGSLGYLFWRLGAFGGADAKAIMTLSLCFPVYPSYTLPVGSVPDHRAPLGVFSLTILTNTVLAGLAYPLVLAAGNAARGRFALPMAIGRPVGVESVTERYGRLLETPAGFTRSGLDLDTLRMYLRWRGTTLSAVRDAPAAFRDPDSVPPPGARNDPTSGSVAEGDPVTDGGSPDAERPRIDDGEGRGDGGTVLPAPGVPTTDTPATPAVRRVDAWGAAAFLDDVGHAYGANAADLRAALALLTESDREAVWVSPGIPFVVPMFVGLVLALVVGDVLLLLLGAT
ncbi:A24 family peptidase [Haloglomus litoreum]|uniref:A24 family peptidase n=1 Tax=Haloglomus litoreum TaxID=3034026 RepID=UPI0023E7F99D|nr:A24 family peptidase [Haloglomus sp. DT116]